MCSASWAQNNSRSPAQLVVRPFDKLQFIQRDSNTLQHGLNDLLIVLNPELKQLPRCLHIVQVGMKVGKKDRHLPITNEWRSVSALIKLNATK